MTVDPTSFLLVTSQIGVVLAGFAGLLGGIRGSRSHWHPMYLFGLRLIISFSLTAVFLSLLPLLIRVSSGSDHIAFAISSVCLAAGLLGLQIDGILRFRRQRLHFRRRFGAFITNVGSPIIDLLLLVNAFSWSSFAIYAWGMTWLLFVPAVQFLIFILVTAEEHPN